jgi:hypothetical protein
MRQLCQCRSKRLFEFASLPLLDLPAHQLEVALHAIHADRDAGNQRERRRVFREHGGKHAGNNVGIFGPYDLNSQKADLWASLPHGSVSGSTKFRSQFHLRKSRI